MLHLHTFYKLMTISKASISPFFYNDTNYLFIVYQEAERGDSRTLLLLLICTEKYVLKHTLQYRLRQTLQYFECTRTYYEHT